MLPLRGYWEIHIFSSLLLPSLLHAFPPASKLSRGSPIKELLWQLGIGFGGKENRKEDEMTGSAKRSQGVLTQPEVATSTKTAGWVKKENGLGDSFLGFSCYISYT